MTLCTAGMSFQIFSTAWSGYVALLLGDDYWRDFDAVLLVKKP